MDAFGNTVTGYRGKVKFTSTDTQASLPADYTFTAADAGIHTFTVALKTATPNGVVWSFSVVDAVERRHARDDHELRGDERRRGEVRPQRADEHHGGHAVHAQGDASSTPTGTR